MHSSFYELAVLFQYSVLLKNLPQVASGCAEYPLVNKAIIGLPVYLWTPRAPFYLMDFFCTAQLPHPSIEAQSNQSFTRINAESNPGLLVEKLKWKLCAMKQTPSEVERDYSEHWKFFNEKTPLLWFKPRASGSWSVYANHCAILPPPPAPLYQLLLNGAPSALDVATGPGC